MRKVIILVIAFGCLFNMNAQDKKPNEIKMITTKQYNEPYDLVFKSMMSLMHSKKFMLDDTDYLTGLIVVSKETYKRKRAEKYKGVILIDNINDDLTEVKLNMNIINSKAKSSSGITLTYGHMLEDAEYYSRWFSDLYVEIARRKALLGD